MSVETGDRKDINGGGTDGSSGGWLLLLCYALCTAVCSLTQVSDELDGKTFFFLLSISLSIHLLNSTNARPDHTRLKRRRKTINLSQYPSLSLSSLLVLYWYTSLQHGAFSFLKNANQTCSCFLHKNMFTHCVSYKKKREEWIYFFCNAMFNVA